jgi:hypothetical protein
MKMGKGVSRFPCLKETAETTSVVSLSPLKPIQFRGLLEDAESIFNFASVAQILNKKLDPFSKNYNLKAVLRRRSRKVPNLFLWSRSQRRNTTAPPPNVQN